MTFPYRNPLQSSARARQSPVPRHAARPFGLLAARSQRWVTGLASLAVLVPAALLPLTAGAAGSATVKADKDTSHIEWLDTHTVRMDRTGDDSYMILRDGKAYLVSMDKGQPRVMEMGDMVKAFTQVAKGMQKRKGPGSSRIQAMDVPKIDSLKDTGTSETVAGIEGHVYDLTTTNSKGKTETMQAVLTDNPVVTELTQAYLSTARALVDDPSLDDFENALPQNRRGILRVGDKYRIETVSDEAPGASQFELPAQPTDMRDMMQGVAKQLQQMQKQMQK